MPIACNAELPVISLRLSNLSLGTELSCQKVILDPGTAMIGLTRDDPLTFTFLGGGRGRLLLGILLSPVGSGMTFSYLQSRTGKPS